MHDMPDVRSGVCLFAEFEEKEVSLNVATNLLRKDHTLRLGDQAGRARTVLRRSSI